MSNPKLEDVIAFMAHQSVWNSLDGKWTRPSYCVTCTNIGFLRRQFADEQKP